MDLNDLKSTVSNLTLYDLKAGFRKAQNAVMNYTEMEAKVREATNNEPWGASSTLMQEIANATFSYQSLNEIMPMIYRRFTEKSAEEWRQIYKALQLLEFLIKHGSERVIDDARGHITLLKMLRQFHFIDQNGKDQGINVRNRAKELSELLGDVERIRSERKKARATKNKYTGVEGGMTFGGGFSGGSGSRYGGFGSESANYGGFSGGVYGDGGGFGGETDGYRESGGGGGGGRSDNFEEYDEFDEADRPSGSSRTARKTERASSKKVAAEPPKKKEPEVDLFSFDDPIQNSSSTAAAPGQRSGLADLSGPSSGHTAANDDDEFDDFQSAAPATQPAAQPQPAPLMSTASSTAQFAAPRPLSGPQNANLSQMVSSSSISPAPSSGATPGVNYSAFAAPAAQAQPPKPTTFQPSGPNYFGGIQAQASNPAPPSSMSTSSSTGPTTMANMKPVTSPGAKPTGAASGGDAFGALWGKASSGIKKTDKPTGGPAMGQLAKEKSSAGIWGAPATSSQSSIGGAPAGNNGSASGDLLG
ncbi:Epsin-3, clathrin recruitment and traffic between the Golgi and endosome [Conoideocrella luteorostrata]|uniref:Epsin-3, clathrin recruitment and traffic between the Golgi and endosome n=1 Tax=Conoideocrella luteorostrata TaxID=1105319 RepID=A0AAJ0CPZ0_9HYPO|nr:Epsin-3, clathrin recruitment and traffic between the Golgi and endosome [Conoideocrella luteorostrata]